MGVEIQGRRPKRFGSQTIWNDVTLTLPAGEISVMLGPSGTGKSVFLKTLVEVLKPDAGSIWIEGKDLTRLREHDLYEVRKLFGVLFQDGALFGSMSLYDNIAPSRCASTPARTRARSAASSARKIELVGLQGAEGKLYGEISGGMRKRAGLARALVLDPEIILFDEPDSGLGQVRTAYLNQLIVDLNAQIEATFLIVTHDINTARTVPDNIGLLYHRHLAMFGPREMLLSSEEPVVRQFLNAQQVEADRDVRGEGRRRARRRESGQELPPLPPIALQLEPSDGSLRRTARPAGEWCRANGVTPPPARSRPATPASPSQPRTGAGRGGPVSNPAIGALRPERVALRARLDVLRALPKRPFQTKEFIQRWFIASVTIVPTALVSIPFGACIALQLGTLTRQLGAQSFTGAATCWPSSGRPRRSSPPC